MFPLGVLKNTLLAVSAPVRVDAAASRLALAARRTMLTATNRMTFRRVVRIPGIIAVTKVSNRGARAGLAKLATPPAPSLPRQGDGGPTLSVAEPLVLGLAPLLPKNDAWTRYRPIFIGRNETVACVPTTRGLNCFTNTQPFSGSK
jgi:hypothetical protein